MAYVVAVIIVHVGAGVHFLENELAIFLRVVPSSFNCIIYNVGSTLEICCVRKVYLPYTVVVWDCHYTIVGNTLCNPMAASHYCKDPSLVAVCYHIGTAAATVALLLNKLSGNLHCVSCRACLLPY